MTLKIDSTLFDVLSGEMEKDLISLFNLMKDDVLLLQDKALKENWTPQEYLEALEILFE